MKSPQAFRSIGEVAQLIGVATHVLRYWETQFPALAPVRRPDGRRYYRPDDVQLAAGLCVVMREEGLTIRGARRLIALDRGEGLRERGRERLAAAPAPPEMSGDSRASGRGPARKAPNTRKPATARPSQPAPQRSGSDLPLFPELDRPSVPAETPAADSAGGSHGWLARLAATAGALRQHSAALPPEARPLRDAIRDAMDRTPGQPV